MLLLDRYILVRFLANFATLFLLLFIFAASIDIIVNLDDFVEAARVKVGEAAGAVRFVIAFIGVTSDFNCRVFSSFMPICMDWWRSARWDSRWRRCTDIANWLR
jgi:hypothetical protein